MNALTETFPAACLTFGFLCAMLALVLDHGERRRLRHSALIRRIECGSPKGRRLMFQEDGKPLCWEEHGLASTELRASKDGLLRSTRRGL